MELNRVVEERLVNLYRQGKIVGGLYRSLGQEATSVGSAIALEDGDILARSSATSARCSCAVRPRASSSTQYLARADLPFGGQGRQHSTSAPSSAA